jgi:ureidoacrylate peracid hydrolase
MEMKLKTERTALVVIDMQIAFCAEVGSLAKAGIDISNLAGAVAPCRQLLDTARQAGVPVIFTRYVFRSDYADGGVVIRYLLPQLSDVNSLAEGTEDIEIVDLLAPAEGEFVIDKNRPSAFYATNIEPILNGLDVDSLVVCGVTTNICVESTVRDASQRDYKVFVVKDATGEIDQLRYDGAIAGMAWMFAKIIDVDDVLSVWGAGAK